jgi:probable LLM family oxidoreductase
MELGIDSFLSDNFGREEQRYSNAEAMKLFLERINYADHCGLDFYGVGEHHRKGFLDSSPVTILAAAAALTKKIRLGSAVTVLSAADPVRIFQSFATLDLISGGRAEMVVGRGSSVEAFPLFGFDLQDYDALFEEKLDLLLKIRAEEVISWSGKFRAPIHHLPVYPRPLQNPLPIWLGVGGTPSSFVRAGRLGLPLVIAVIGGETHRFRPLVDLYREAGIKAGYAEDQLKVSLHSLGYLAESTEKAIADYAPGHFYFINKFGKERGWPPMTPERFAFSRSETGFLLLGSPEEVAEKIKRHSLALGGLSRVTFQMDNAGLSQEQILNATELIGTRLSPYLNSSAN